MSERVALITGAARGMRAAGPVVAYSLAAARIFSAGTPVICSTRARSAA